MNAKENTKSFYGWWIVAASFVSLFVSIGIGFFPFGVFFKYLITEFHWSRTNLSLAYSLSSFISALAGPLMGRWTDGYGPRMVMIPCAMIFGTCLIALYWLAHLYTLYFLYLIIGLTTAGLGTIPTNAVVCQWFIKKRGLAMGIVYLGIGLGGMIMPILSHYLILRFGWRLTYGLFGLTVWVVALPIISILMKGKPEEMGVSPDGERLEGYAINPSIPEGLAVKDALRTSNFWLLIVAFFLQPAAFISVNVHLVPYAMDIGFSGKIAASTLSFMMGMSLLGRMTFGFISDKFNKKNLFLLAIFMEVMGLFVLMRVKAPWMLYLFGIFFGLGMGGCAPLRPVLVGECFGVRSFGEIFGYLILAFSFGMAIGPPFSGYIFDVFHSYRWAFNGLIFTYILTLLSIYFIHIPGPSSWRA